MQINFYDCKKSNFTCFKNLICTFLSSPEQGKDNFIVPDVEGFKQLSAEEKLIVAECLDFIIRFAASFDMRRSTWGTGRNYDSLSGFAYLIGYFSKKIDAYIGLNRKCRKCDLDHPPNHPDCCRNFVGSAKTMGARAAAILANENKILKECKMELGLTICDNDGGIAKAMNEGCAHDIFKLIKITRARALEVKFMELKTTIRKKCFNYAVF